MYINLVDLTLENEYSLSRALGVINGAILVHLKGTKQCL